MIALVAFEVLFWGACVTKLALEARRRRALKRNVIRQVMGEI